MNIKTVNLPSRFLKKMIELPSGCWEWIGCKNDVGYGQLWDKSSQKVVYAHRFAYKTLIKPIPIGLEIDHLCRNRACVNPDHLELVTRKVNCQRGLTGQITGDYNKSKTHCPYGHPYDKLNTYIPPKGGRVCRVCKRIKDRERIKFKNAL